jgi:uncharacterized protein YkwD
VSSARKILLAIALVSVGTLGVGSSASGATCPNTGVMAPALSPPEVESSVGCLINQERVRYGLQPLQPNGTLRAAALSHSTEMVSQSYFDHTSPAGLTFIDRIESMGYMHGARSWVVGENLIWGSGALSAPEVIVRSWMESPPHRENILRGRFQEIGIAVLPGTPEAAGDATGLTVSSEFGDRAFGKRARQAKRTRGAAARR